jgi:hypothetical protein
VSRRFSSGRLCATSRLSHRDTIGAASCSQQTRPWGWEKPGPTPTCLGSSGWHLAEAAVVFEAQASQASPRWFIRLAYRDDRSVAARATPRPPRRAIRNNGPDLGTLAVGMLQNALPDVRAARRPGGGVSCGEGVDVVFHSLCCYAFLIRNCAV